VVGRAPQTAKLTLARTLVFRPHAEYEILEVRQRYDARSAGLGRQFADAVDVLIERMSTIRSRSRVSGTRPGALL
jgi:hypothetical protein